MSTTTLETAKPIRRRSKQEPTPFLDPATIKERFYGLKLSGHCLHPVFKNGDKVIFDREAPLVNGCFGNFFYRPELVKPGQLSIALKKLIFAPPPKQRRARRRWQRY